MNNPFSRLKHYVVGDINPQENHATECLAACLVFSPQFRGSFLGFLFGDEKPPVCDSSAIEVISQQSIPDGYVDLLLQDGARFGVAVEVKVEDQNKDRHCNQLQKYRKWLNQEWESNGHLFTLVKHVDESFSPDQYGANHKGRRTWRELYNHLQNMLREPALSEVESSLLENFCDYLESEGIVSTYETSDLLSYGPGVKARKAVTGIFNQVASRLEADSFETVCVEDRKDHWPQLRIKHPDWKKIPGGSSLWISLWFCVPGIWEAGKHEFWFNIILWDVGYGDDWESTKASLPKWLPSLKSKEYDCTVLQTWNKERKNVEAREIQNQPKRIFAERKRSEGETLLKAPPQGEGDLVNLLVERAKEYAKIVNSLGV